MPSKEKLKAVLKSKRPTSEWLSMISYFEAERKKLAQHLLIAFLLLFSAIAKGKQELLEIEIFIQDHVFHPEVVNIPQGRKVRLTIYNKDDTIEEFESSDLKREKIILPNSFIHVVLAPLKPGKYEFMGEFHSDTARGYIIVD